MFAWNLTSPMSMEKKEMGKTKHVWFSALLTGLLSLLVVGYGHAQNSTFTLSWWSVDNGGGYIATDDGQYAMMSAIGQPDAGDLSGSQTGDYHLASGFVVPSLFHERIIDDRDCGIQYGDWYGISDESFIGGCARASRFLGQWLAYQTTQTSNAITWVTYRGPDQGRAWVMIDGQMQGLTDLYSAIPQYLVPQVYSGLPNTQHTIVVGPTGQQNPGSSGTEIRIDGFNIGQQFVDDSSPNVAYGPWKGIVSSQSYNGSFRVTASAGVTVTFDTSGTEFTWITTLCPSCGNALVWVDGAPALVVDTYAPTWTFQHEQLISGLPRGSHKIVIQALGTHNPDSSGNLVIFDGYRTP